MLLQPRQIFDGNRQPLSQLLVEKAVEAIAWSGAGNVTMRSVSAGAGGTTAAIVHHYGSKSGLIAAAIDAAMEDERVLHGSLKNMLSGRPLGHLNFTEWVAQYVMQRTTNSSARFWSELLFHANQIEGAPAAIADWHAMRLGFWSEILATQQCDQTMADYIVTYLCMEEAWAQGLAGFREYPLLLRETLRAATSNLFSSRWDEAHSVSDWLEERLSRFSLHAPSDPNSLDQRLLSLAADDIFANGIANLNQRRIAERAGVSPSMIAYHFGTMAAFRNQAIWRAMLHPIADPSNPYSHHREVLTLDDWSSLMGDTISPASNGREAGFYVPFSRMIGEIALLSHREPEMEPLAEHLRILDGSASYQTSKTRWHGVLSFQRGQASAFAVWMKGRAVLNEVLQVDRSETKRMLVGAVTDFVVVAGRTS